MKKILMVLITLLLLCGCSRVEPENISNDKVDKINENLYKWNYYTEKNEDYIGTIKFESELINLPFFKGETNDTYLRTNWETMEYDIYGSIFMDSGCELDSQNIIIYGHYVDYAYDPNGENIMFTPLKKLMFENNYQDNKYIDLILKDETRRYEIVAVYYCPLVEEDGLWYISNNLIYNVANYTLNEFNEYKTAVQNAQLYSTGVDFVFEDKLLTLQTCVEGREDLREIVLAKQVSN